MTASASLPPNRIPEAMRLLYQPERLYEQLRAGQLRSVSAGPDVSIPAEASPLGQRSQPTEPTRWAS
jgi:hypothetical protein